MDPDSVDKAISRDLAALMPAKERMQLRQRRDVHAFPTVYYQSNQNGMGLRDWFAGQALAGMDDGCLDVMSMADRAYRIADAMMDKREEK